MQRAVNIKSLLQSKQSLDGPAFESYMAHLGVDIRVAELEDLEVLAQSLEDAGCKITEFDMFHVGYKIPQIGKEFDLLRFGKDSVINIELKNDCTEAKILKQLLRNKYYLSFLGKNVYNFTFVSKTKNLYYLNHAELLEAVSIEQLAQHLSGQAAAVTSDIDHLFEPSDYLVSPFNLTARFLAGQYFLTHQQEEVKEKVIKGLTRPENAKFFSISGAAGTGKTLLTYDIARQLKNQGESVLIIHCGQLNHGHEELIKSSWHITPIKGYAAKNLANFDLVVIDEAQRIYKPQLDDIVSKTQINKNCCIFSYDSSQTLSNQEAYNDIPTEIQKIGGLNSFRLSEKIRTNKEIAALIKMLFNKKRPSIPISGKNVSINYFNNNEDAKDYLKGLDPKEWEVLRFTPSQYNTEHHEKYYDTWSKTSHKVIGQEFDGVAIAIDQYFTYDEDGNLSYRDRAYYAPVKMLFQNITRARKRLNLVIINNEELMARCLKILQ